MTMAGPAIIDVENAVAAYRAYGESVGWVNFAGNPMPEWAELPERIRTAWAEAARVVRERTEDRP